VYYRQNASTPTPCLGNLANARLPQFNETKFSRHKKAIERNQQYSDNDQE
jgi:hypothetical protein